MKGKFFEGPKKLEWEVLTDTYGKLTIEPFRKGIATTIGNSLRRMLLSSIEGTCITSLKIQGILHEFTAIPGIVEDPIDLILNIRGIVFKYEGYEKKELFLSAGKGSVTAGMIKTPSDVIIVNPDHYLATVSDGKLEIEMELEKGVGYLPADEGKREERIGTLPVDAYFSPIKRILFNVENVRVGMMTDYEKLILEVTTNGAIDPKKAVSSAASLLSDYISIFIEPEPFEIKEVPPVKVDEERENLKKILDMELDELEISVRAKNCLQAAGIIKVGDLVVIKEDDLLRMRNFGRKSLTEIKERLSEYNLTLGMTELKDLIKLWKKESNETQEETS